MDFLVPKLSSIFATKLSQVFLYTSKLSVRNDTCFPRSINVSLLIENKVKRLSLYPFAVDVEKVANYLK